MSGRGATATIPTPGSGHAASRPLGPGIYLHVPFCRHRCGYCDFFTAVGSERARERFLDDLSREIELASRALFRGARFQTVFLGGGTPSLLTGRQMRRLLETLVARFEIAPDAEITVECNPESITPARMEAYRAAGVNRISLGVQSMQEGELRLLERIHDAGAVRRRVSQLRRAGFQSVNLDLIYGLPEVAASGGEPAPAELGEPRGPRATRPAGEGTRWERTLEDALSLEPDHLSAYLLTLEPRVPLARRFRKDRTPLPEGGAAREQYQSLRARARAAGLAQYEISNFARPGHECRHNQNYWIRGDYLGLGPSAHSHEAGRRWANVSSMTGYHEAVRAGRLPWSHEERIEGTERAAEWIFLGLRRTEGVSWPLLAEAAGDRGAALEREVGRLVAGGLLERDGDRLKLTAEAYFVSDGVFSELLLALP